MITELEYSIPIDGIMREYEAYVRDGGISLHQFFLSIDRDMFIRFIGKVRPSSFSSSFSAAMMGIIPENLMYAQDFTVVLYSLEIYGTMPYVGMQIDMQELEEVYDIFQTCITNIMNVRLRGYHVVTKGTYDFGWTFISDDALRCKADTNLIPLLTSIQRHLR